MSPNSTEAVEEVVEQSTNQDFPADLEPEWSLGKLYDAYRAVVDLKAGAKKWPFKLGWQIDDLVELFKPHASKFEVRQLQIMQQFGKQVENKNAKPGEVSFILSQPEEYKEAVRTLSLTVPSEFKADLIKPVTFSELEKVEGLEISSDALRVLRYLGLVTS